jgi:uncharacterized protein DUF5666
MKLLSRVLLMLVFATPLAAHEGGHDSRGVVVSIAEKELTVKTSQGEEKFVLTPQTQFVKDRSPASAQDLRASDRVVVHATKNGKRLEAVKVEFKSAKKR